MPQQPKKSREDQPRPTDVPATENWANDQKEHDYYYDDSHGYEVYEDEDDDDDDDPVIDSKRP